MPRRIAQPFPLLLLGLRDRFMQQLQRAVHVVHRFAVHQGRGRGCRTDGAEDSEEGSSRARRVKSRRVERVCRSAGTSSDKQEKITCAQLACLSATIVIIRMSEPSLLETMDPPVNGHNADHNSQLSEGLLNTLRKLQKSITRPATTAALPTSTQSTAQKT